MKKKVSIKSFLHILADSESFLNCEDELSNLINDELQRTTNPPIAADELSDEELEILVAAGTPNRKPKKI